MPRLPRAALAVLLGAALAACADRSQPDGSGRHAVPPDNSTVDLLELRPGDRGCYAVLRAEGEAPREELAAPDVCEQTALVGTRVRVVVDPAARVPAASCEGDPDCPDTETARLITALEPG